MKIKSVIAALFRSRSKPPVTFTVQQMLGWRDIGEKAVRGEMQAKLDFANDEIKRLHEQVSFLSTELAVARVLDRAAIGEQPKSQTVH